MPSSEDLPFGHLSCRGTVQDGVERGKEAQSTLEIFPSRRIPTNGN